MRLLFILILFVPTIALSQLESHKWDYPVKPGSEEWKTLNSHQSMVDKCQIPNDLLPNLSTKDLVKICLDYPLFFTMKAFNNLQEGFDQVSTEFNGFQELFKRKDAGIELLKIYQTINPKLIETMLTPLERGAHKKRIFFIEFILAQRIIIENLSQNEVKQLLNEALKKLEEKKKLRFSTFSTQITSLIMCRNLEFLKFENYTKLNNETEKFKHFSSSIMLSDLEMIDDLRKITTEYLKSAN